MININVSKGARTIADRLINLSDKVKYRALSSLICFFLFNCRSLSDAVRRFPFSVSVSSLANAAKLFPFNRFRQRLLQSVLRKYGGKIDNKNFAFVIDDTGNPKSGLNIFGKGVWGGSQGTYNGQKILLLALVDLRSHIAIPLAYEILPKRKNKNAPTAMEQVVQLLKLVLEAGYPNLDVVADSWFDSVALMHDINALGCHFVCEIKSNRRVKSNPGKNVRTRSLADIFNEVKRVRTITSWDSQAIQKRKKKGKCIAELHLKLNNKKVAVKSIAVYNRRNSTNAFAYYASTNQAMSRARIWMLSRARWSIECIFRTVKQCLSFGRLSCGGESAAHLAVGMPFYLYALLQLEPPQFWGLTEKESPDRMLAKIAEQGLQKSMDIMLGNPEHPRLKILRTRRDVKNVSRKPTNKPAGERMAA